MKQLKIKSIKKRQFFLEFLLLFMLVGGIFLICDQVIVNDSKEDNLRKDEDIIHSNQYYIDCLKKLTNNPIGSAADNEGLNYSTFIGGSDGDQGLSIAIDTEGCAYFTGRTRSSNFPTTAGAFDETYNGGVYDVFICKLSADGSSLVYSTFIGGSSSDAGWSIAVAPDGSTYVTGYTYSTDFNITAGAFDETINGDYDVFVCKLSADGSSLIYSTFIGGSNSDEGCSITIAPDGSAYITGETESSDFNITAGAFDETHNGGDDVFTCKLSPDGSSLVYSTFIGGSSFESAESIATATDGTAYITGLVQSSNFPTTIGAFDETYNGGSDAFVCRLSADGSSLENSTFIGGTGFEHAYSIAIATDGSAYVTGYTQSSDFNITSGAFDETFNGGRDVFIFKLSTDGSSLIYSTFIGGNGDDYGRSIAIDAVGCTYIMGIAGSNFPITTGAFDKTIDGGSDVFVCNLNADGSNLVCSTYIGGSNSDSGNSIALAADGTVYISGFASSSNFPTTIGAFDETINGDYDVFVCKFNSLIGGGSSGNDDDDDDDDEDNDDDQINIPSFPLYLVIGISWIVIIFIIVRNKTKRRFIFK